MYLCVKGIYFVSFYELSIVFWNCSATPSIVFSPFSTLPNTILTDARNMKGTKMFSIDVIYSNHKTDAERVFSVMLNF